MKLMRDVPAPARILGLSGLIPFVGLAALSLIGPEGWRDTVLKALAYYGATILAFMGGCRWGFAAAGLGEGPSLKLLGLSVIPSLWAWLSLMLPPPFEKEMLALGLVLLYAADVALKLEGGSPEWWLRLRLPLTLIAAASLIAAVWA
jgi:hypothetical protein